MIVRFHPQAELEFEHSADHYYELDPDLAVRFHSEIQAAILRILHHPNAWPLGINDTRQCRVHGFPYTLVYKTIRSEIFIIAVAHQRKNPNYWRFRD